MKYITLFENFDSSETDYKYYKILRDDILKSIEDDVIDIFQHMKDEHKGSEDLFICVKSFREVVNDNVIRIDFGYEYHDTDMTVIDTKKYKDDFLRLNDYLNEIGFEFNYFCWDDSGKIEWVYPPEKHNNEDNSIDIIFKIKPTNHIRMYYRDKGIFEKFTNTIYKKKNENLKLVDLSNIILDLRELCYELSDENIIWRIYPDSEIRKNILSFQLRDILDKNRPDKVEFYLEIHINSKLTDPNKRSGMFDAPEWFIIFLKRIENSMSYYDFKTI